MRILDVLLAISHTEVTEHLLSMHIYSTAITWHLFQRAAVRCWPACGVEYVRLRSAVMYPPRAHDCLLPPSAGLTRCKM